MNKFNFTPRTYQSAECLLAKTAQVLSCEQEAKACLLNSYKHHSKGNLIQDNYRYDFFAKSLGVCEDRYILNLFQWSQLLDAIFLISLYKPLFIKSMVSIHSCNMRE